MFSKKNLIISIILLSNVYNLSFSMEPTMETLKPESRQRTIDVIQKVINQKLNNLENMKRLQQGQRIDPLLEENIKNIQDQIKALKTIISEL